MRFQVDLLNWMIVTTSRDASKSLEFVNMYIQCARDMGIRVEKPAVYQLQNDRTETYLREIRQKMNDQVRLDSLAIVLQLLSAAGLIT